MCVFVWYRVLNVCVFIWHRVLNVRVFVWHRMLSEPCRFCTEINSVDFKDNFDHNTVDIIDNCVYVDSCSASSPSVEEAKRMLKEVSKLLNKGDFKITEWVYNIGEVINTLPKFDRSTELRNLNLCSADPQKNAL